MEPQTQVISTLYKIINPNLRKILVLTGGIAGFVATLSFISKEFMMYLEDFFLVNISASSFSIMAALISMIAFSLYYLQFGGRREEEVESFNNRELDRLNARLRTQERKNNVSSERLEEILTEFKEQLEQNREDSSILSPEEKEKLINDFSDSVYGESAKFYIEQQALELKLKIEEETKSKLLESNVSETKKRLIKEIGKLGLRANFNLAIGMGITAGGLYLLWDTVALLNASDSLKQAALSKDIPASIFLKSFSLEFFPRLSLVLFIEIFAYFFLKLYKEGLAEIKYFQNELTNIDSKSLALSAISSLPQSDLLSNVIDKLSSTERNHILEKGQTTVDLEKAKSDGAITQGIISAIPELFKSKNS